MDSDADAVRTRITNVLFGQKLDQLRIIGKELKVPNYKNMTKASLVKAIVLGNDHHHLMQHLLTNKYASAEGTPANVLQPTEGCIFKLLNIIFQKYFVQFGLSEGGISRQQLDAGKTGHNSDIWHSITLDFNNPLLKDFDQLAFDD